MENKTDIDSGDCPFITILNNFWVVVYAIYSEIVRIAKPGNGGVQELEIARSTFIENWDGRALLIGDYADATEPDNDKDKKYNARNRFKKACVLAAAIALVITGLIHSIYLKEWLYYAVILVNLFGLFISCLLLKKQLHIHSGIADKLCGFIKESRCENVTDSAGANSEDRTDINRYIIAHYKKYGPEETWKMLTEWYGGGKWQKAEFFKKYDLDIRNDDVENEFAKQKAWPQDKPFTGTPTVLVNGYELKWPYEVDDYMEVAL